MEALALHFCLRMKGRWVELRFDFQVMSRTISSILTWPTDLDWLQQGFKNFCNSSQSWHKFPLTVFADPLKKSGIWKHLNYQCVSGRSLSSSAQPMFWMWQAVSALLLEMEPKWNEQTVWSKACRENQVWFQETKSLYPGEIGSPGLVKRVQFFVSWILVLFCVFFRVWLAFNWGDPQKIFWKTEFNQYLANQFPKLLGLRD